MKRNQNKNCSKKSFLIVGSLNGITYKEIFPKVMNNLIWEGVSHPKDFIQPNDENKGFGNVIWYTNIETDKHYTELVLKSSYNAQNYPIYDNYNAIEVSKVSEIPCDYKGIMGVPITFLEKHNPRQFKIVGATESEGVGLSFGLFDETFDIRQPLINGEKVYKRIFIKNIKL